MSRIHFWASFSLALLLASCGGASSPTTPSNNMVATSISPTSGSTFGGTTVTISGTNFAADAVVTIGGVPTTNVAVVSTSSITATTGQRAAGLADVAVTSFSRTAILSSGFTYVPPGPIVNAPPTIVSLGAQGTRPGEPSQFADLDESINVTAVVQDLETPVQQLTYEWSSNAGGSFTGSGAAVMWRAPAIAAPATLTVTVTERYNDADPITGLPVPKENRVRRSIIVSVHDSAREVGDMARQFLLDFSNSNIRDVNFILRNFTTTCPDRASEFDDITSNRQHFRITSSSIGSATVSVGFGGFCPFRGKRGDACAQVRADWVSTFLDNGSTQHVVGTDQVTAVYLPNEGGWRLCGSDFNGQSAMSLRHAFIR